MKIKKNGKVIRLTESDLKKIVKRIIKENESKLDLNSVNISLDILDAAIEDIRYDKDIIGDTINIKTTEEKRTGYFGRDLLIRMENDELNIESVKLTSSPNDSSKVSSIIFKNKHDGAMIKLPVSILTSGSERDGRFYLGTTTLLITDVNGDTFELSLDLSSLYQNNN